MTTKHVIDRSFKRSIDGIFTVFANLKNQKTGEVEKPLKSALYNVGILIMLCAFVGVFLVLLPFLTPLCWAFLFGAVLFPAKKKVAFAIEGWIDRIEAEELPFVIGVFKIPFDVLERMGKSITRWLIAHHKILMIGLGSIVSLRLILVFVPNVLFSTLLNILVWLHTFFSSFVGSLSLMLVLAVIICYAIAVVMLWNSSSNVFTILGQSMWVFIVAYLCSFLGVLAPFAFVGAMIYGLVGLIYDEESHENIQIMDRFKNVFKRESSEEVNSEPVTSKREDVMATPIGRFANKTKSQLTEIKHKMQLNLHPEHKKTKSKEVELESSMYFQILFYAVLATVLWHQLWIVFLCFVPITFYGVKELCKILRIWNYVEDQWKASGMDNWIEQRRTALLPVCLPGVLQLNQRIHKFVCTKLKSFVDDISAVFMILFLIVFVIFLSVFFFFQIYSEAITVAQLSSNLINRTLSLRPDLVNIIPVNMQSMNDIIDNAYKYSRGTIEDYLDNVFNETNPEQAGKLKVQILSVWDRLIQSYMDRNNEGMGPRVPSESVLSTLDEIVSTSGVTFPGLFAWAKSNLGMLMEVSDSLWIVLKANLSLLISTMTTLFSVLLGSGQTMIRFLFNTIIFFTTLYYLLQSSKDRYAPIAMNINSAWGSTIADALEGSVQSVLVATMKLSLFHGLFTWLTHTVFGAHVVYLPAILASLLAAAPFLENYWCCLPAFLDLWLSQDRFYLGLLLVLIHFIIPTNFNPVIHSEIKGGGHPYLTALSIVGGMYLFGIEGAILGPLLLCFLVVLSSITVSCLNSTPSTFTRQSSLEESNSLASPATDWEFTRKIAESDSTNLDSTI